MAKILLTEEEKCNIFHTCLCNSLTYMTGYGLLLIHDDNEYKKAKDKLKLTKDSISYEDILLQLLKDGGTLSFLDSENNDSDLEKPLTYQEMLDRIENVNFLTLSSHIREENDALTDDIILQVIFFDLKDGEPILS